MSSVNDKNNPCAQSSGFDSKYIYLDTSVKSSKTRFLSNCDVQALVRLTTRCLAAYESYCSIKNRSRFFAFAIQ